MVAITSHVEARCARCSDRIELLGTDWHHAAGASHVVELVLELERLSVRLPVGPRRILGRSADGLEDQVSR